MVTRQAHRLHHRLRPRHVERHLVQPRQRAQAAYVVRGDRVQPAQRRPEVARPDDRPVHAVLVEVIAEHVDAIRARQVVEHVAVEIGQRDPGRRLVESADPQVLPHEAAVLERDPIRGRELQVGKARRGLVGQLARLGETLLVQLGEAHEAGVSAVRHLGGCAVGSKDPLVVVFVERDLLGHGEPDARVPAQRRVLRPRQLQPPLQFDQQQDQRHGADRIGDEMRAHVPPWVLK